MDERTCIEQEELSTPVEEAIQNDVLVGDGAVECSEAETKADQETIPQEEIAVEPELPHVDSAAGETPSQKEKKGFNKKLIYIAAAGLVVIGIVFVIIFSAVIRPNSIYSDAAIALENSDFQECQRLLDQIPKHKSAPALKKELTYAMAESYIDEGELDIAESLLVTMPGDPKAKELKDDIQYLRAVELVNQGKFDDAKLVLDKIPTHSDPEQLHEKISYANANVSLEKGDYKTAYELFSQLGDFKDAAVQKEVVYYEALAFKSLFNIQPTLKNPASLRVTKVTFYESVASGELDAIYEITATNSYGGSLGAYVYDLSLYDGEDDSDMISHSSYVDPDNTLDSLHRAFINIIKARTVFETTVDVARMNRLLEGNASFNIDLPFKAADEVES